MKHLYIKVSSSILIFSALAAICLLALTNCENPFIDSALQPKRIIFETNGGSNVPTQIVYRGETITKPNDPQKGINEFLGWFTDNNYFTNEWDFTFIPDGDMTLFAKWTDFNAIEIPSVNINIINPEKGANASLTASVAPDSPYSAGSVSWNPNHISFLGGQQYTATVTLSASSGYMFRQSGFSATVNESLNASVLSNSGATVTISCAFPATLEKSVESVEIVAEPGDMNYLHGDTLNLHGLYVTLTYTDGSSDVNITPDSFAARGIYTSVSNGTILSYSAAYNNLPITVTAGGVSAQTTSNLVIGLRLIPSVSLTIAAPVAGQIPSTMVNYNGNFSAGNVTWSPAVTDKFLGSTEYTASITLTANENYTFTGGLASATINGNTAFVVNNGDTAVLSYAFASTSGKSVIGISITSMPANLNYTHGQTLDLTGLSATLLYNDETTLAVPLANFSANNITTVPAAGAQVLRSTHNSNPILVIYNESASLRTSTNTLTVNPKTITITGVTAVNRPFNGTTTVALTGGTLQGVETFDTVTFTLGSGTMENDDVGNNKQVTTNITLTGNSASNYTLTQLTPASVLVNITPGQITSASVSVSVPVGNMEPSPAVFSSGNYSATASWLRNGSPFTGTFQNGNEYTSVVTLTADDNYTFADSITASINGGSASVSNNTGSTVEIRRTFQTAEKAVINIAINTQPSSISYTHDQPVVLTGLSVTLTYNDFTTETVQLADFASKSLTTSPANGSILSRTDHNHAPITVIYNNSAIRASTNQLSISKAAGAAITVQNPSFVSGNSYTVSAPVDPVTGQSIEYAISTSASAALTELSWQTSPAFTIMPYSAATYYWYARTAENNDYLAGALARSGNGIAFYSVTFNSDGGSFTPSVQIVRNGQLATAPASNPTKAGFGFYGWLNGAETWNFTSSTVSANTTLTADWRANQIFSIGFDLITDLASDINIPSGLSFSRSGASGQNTGITITLPAPPAGQTYSNIMWEHGGHTLSTTNSVTLNNDDIRVNLAGNNKILSLIVFINGVPYSKNVTFNVVP